MTNMKDKDTISKGPKKRDAACLRVQHDIVIPAGTILRQEPGSKISLFSTFSCPVGFGRFVVTDESAQDHADVFKRVIA